MINNEHLDFFKQNDIDIEALKETAKSLNAKMEVKLSEKVTLVLTKLNYADAFEIFNIFLLQAGKEDFVGGLMKNKHITDCFVKNNVLNVENETFTNCTFETLYDKGLAHNTIKVLFTFVLLNALPFFPIPTTTNNGSK